MSILLNNRWQIRLALDYHLEGKKTTNKRKNYAVYLAISVKERC